MRKLLLFSIVTLLFISGCRTNSSQEKSDIIIFHAGSLSVPFHELKEVYSKRNPGINLLLEPAGSIVCARKITELKKPCDIMASADYYVINQLLIPEYADWSIRFATNEIVIAFSDKARYSDEIDSVNCFDILLRDDVLYGRSDPDADPCGYRSVLAMKLAEKYYNKPGLADRLTSKNRDYIRPKEVDLVALIESNSVDYMFQYKSVAIQHNLRYVELPAEINLSDPSMEEFYNTAVLSIRGTKPDEKITVRGEFINYSLTVPFDAPNREAAIKFLSFVLGDEGMEIFRKNGQKPLVPLSTEQPGKIPEELKIFLPDIRK